MPTASFVDLRSDVRPESRPAWLRRRSCPGAIAATGHDIRTNAPADAARAPSGAT